MAILLCLLASFPNGSQLVEAESLSVSNGWAVGEARGESAPCGLSGNAALNANVPEASARGSVTLPDGRFAVWVRVYDWGGSPHHYQFDVRVGNVKRTVATSEPLVGGFVWEKWGEVAGGTAVEVELSNADAFNSVCDAILFTPDLAFAPLDGPHVNVVNVEKSVDRATGGPQFSVLIKPEVDLPATQAVFTLLRKSDTTGKPSPYVLWEQQSPVEPGGTDRGIRFSVLPPLDAMVWPGTYELRIRIPNTAWHQGHEVAELEGPKDSSIEPVRARVAMRDGSPALMINDKWENAYAYLAAGGNFDRQFKQFHEIGGRFFSIYGEIGNTPEGFDPAACDGPFFQLLKSAPDALVFPRIDAGPPAWWLAQHPEERVVFDNGTTGLQSFFSKQWLDAAQTWIEDYTRYLRKAPYREHVIGVHICTGYTGEWQSWGLWDDRRGDFSAPALAAWRDYLRAKYGDDSRLARAWGRTITLADAPMPDRARREKAGATMFRTAPEDQDIIDFYDFYWRGTARAIQTLAAAAKRGGGPDFLVGVFYGYFAQYGGKVQESQHLGLREVMDCPDIDFLCSPAMYSDRGPGGTSTFMSMTDSLKLRGKFWWDEADNRTNLAPDTLARAADETETLNLLEREFAHAYTSHTGIWWFDMQGGWYDAPAVLKRLGEFRRYGDTTKAGWEPSVEVAVFYDDKSTYRVAPDSTFMNELPSFFAALPRLGAPYHTYLLADLATVPSHKLYIFVNAFDLTDRERSAIAQLILDGRAVVFLGQAGIGRVLENTAVQHDPAFSRTLTGMPWPMEEEWSIAPPEIGRVALSRTGNPPIARVRDFARQAGVHVYSAGNDAFYAGNGLVSLHAAGDGLRSLEFTEDVVLKEVFPESGQELRGRSFRLPFKPQETRSFKVDLAK